MRMVRISFLFLLGGFASAEMQSALPEAALTITTNELMVHIRFLADDRLEGRGIGGQGNLEATEYVAEKFRNYGLKPAGEAKDLLQPFKIDLNAQLDDSCALVVRVKEERLVLKLGEDFLPFDNLDEGGAFGPLVFAGFGITAPEQGYDDYANIDATNRIVLILRRTPDTARENALFKSRSGRPNTHALFTTKLANAKRHGAKAILIVDASRKRQSIQEMSNGGPKRVGKQKDSLLFTFLSYEQAAEWFKSANRDFASVVEGIDAGQRPDSFRLRSLLVTLKIKIRREKVTVHNVIGLLEGSDPKLKHEYLVIGGHHDHLGYGRDASKRGNPDFVHNGADDNASGTAAVLELAQAFATARTRPKRSLLFMTFNAEERGLIGSRHYVNHPLIPLTNTIAMLNLDMVGRGASGLDVGGVGTSPGFREMVKNIATNFTVKLSLTPGGKAPSDNTSFYNKNMPVLFFFTGKHDDYHKPSDDWQKIDRPEIGQITRMAYLIADQLANSPSRPEFSKSDGNPVRRGRTRLLLGIVIDSEYQGDGVRALDISADFPAGRAGLKKGDILLKLDDVEMSSVADIGRFLARKKKGNKVKASFERGGKAMMKELTL